MICVNGIVYYREDVMEIPHHQQQLDELTAEEIVDDKYVITFSSYLLLVKHCNDVNTDC